MSYVVVCLCTARNINYQRKGKHMTYEYTWKGYEQRVPAKVVGEHFQTLEREHGCVTSQNFLDSARPKDSPVHSLFEWDDTKAAERFRLHQATVIICSLKVTVTEENSEPITVRAYVTTDKHQERSSFFNVQAALMDDNMREKVLALALKEAEAFRRKYADLIELASVMDAIDKLIA